MTKVSNTVSIRKSRMRRRIEKQRMQLSRADVRRFSAAIVSAIIVSPVFQSARTIGIYLNLPGEVQTGALVRRAWCDAKRVCIPVYVRRRRAYAWAWYRPTTVLRRGFFGVREPVRPLLLRNATPDTVIVPGVAFDRAGRRLGRGGGWYDRLLAINAADRPVKTLGVAFNCQLVKRVPVVAKDLPVDIVVTELGIWRAGRVVCSRK